MAALGDIFRSIKTEKMHFDNQKYIILYYHKLLKIEFKYEVFV